MFFVLFSCNIEEQSCTPEAQSLKIEEGILSAKVSLEFEGGVCNILERGLVYSNSDKTPTIKTGINVIIKEKIESNFIQQLNPGEIYYIRSYFKNGRGEVYYSTDFSFLTKKFEFEYERPTHNSVQVRAELNENTTAAEITERGFCWGEKKEPTIKDNKLAIKISEFKGEINGLSDNKIYYVRPYVIRGSKNEVIYGKEQELVTEKAKIDFSTTVKEVKVDKIVLSSKIIESSNKVTERGFVWTLKSTPFPSISDIKAISKDTEVGAFSAEIIEPKAGGLYNIRPYAIAGGKTFYGEFFQITALRVFGESSIPFGIPNAKSVKVMFSIKSEGGYSIIERGFCWSKNSKPTVNDKVKMIPGKVGDITTVIEKLDPSTLYYVRPYVKLNGNRVRYGKEGRVTTESGVFTIATNKIGGVIHQLNMRSSGIKIVGAIENYNGGIVRSTGFCWSTKRNPTVKDTKVEAADFKSTIKFGVDMKLDEEYYIRAFAENGTGVYYGEEIYFSTKTARILDEKFEKELIKLEYDKDPVVNGYVFIDNVRREVFNPIFLNISGKELTNLQGIESFSNLGSLHCNNNELSSIDVSKNTELTVLSLNNNELSEGLDLSKNTRLRILELENNGMEALLLTKNTALGLLRVNKNKLSQIDISKASDLTYFDVSNNAYSGEFTVFLTRNQCIRKKKSDEDITGSIPAEDKLTVVDTNSKPIYTIVDAAKGEISTCE